MSLPESRGILPADAYSQDKRACCVSHLQATLREAGIWVHEPAKGLEVGTTASRTTQAEQTGPCPAMVGVWGRGDV